MDPNGRPVLVLNPGNSERNITRQRVMNVLNSNQHAALALSMNEKRAITNKILNNGGYTHPLNFPKVKYAIVKAIPNSIRNSRLVPYMRFLINAKKTAMANRNRNVSLHPIVINLGKRINAHRLKLFSQGIYNM